MDYVGEDAEGRVGIGMMRGLLSVAELEDLAPFYKSRVIQPSINVS